MRISMAVAALLCTALVTPASAASVKRGVCDVHESVIDPSHFIIKPWGQTWVAADCDFRERTVESVCGPRPELEPPAVALCRIEGTFRTSKAHKFPVLVKVREVT